MRGLAESKENSALRFEDFASRLNGLWMRPSAELDTVLRFVPRSP